MPCLCADLGDGVILHLCRSDGETRPVPRRRRRFWCFSCRKRILHRRMGFYPAFPSYYDPTFWWECPTCKHDYTTFPGCS